jgi:hypothetical protein
MPHFIWILNLLIYMLLVSKMRYLTDFMGFVSNGKTRFLLKRVELAAAVTGRQSRAPVCPLGGSGFLVSGCIQHLRRSCRIPPRHRYADPACEPTAIGLCDVHLSCPARPRYLAQQPVRFVGLTEGKHPPARQTPAMTWVRTLPGLASRGMFLKVSGRFPLGETALQQGATIRVSDGHSHRCSSRGHYAILCNER